MSKVAELLRILIRLLSEQVPAKESSQEPTKPAREPNIRFLPCGDPDCEECQDE